MDRAMTSAALGLPFWATINVILLPLVRGQQPQWTAEEMRALFPALICWLLSCFFLGILSQAARKVAHYFLGPESPARAISRPEKAIQVIILGGGFAGVTTAEHLEKQFRGDPTVSFTLISETNSWLFTPMLVEVATSGLEPTHITTPLRTSLKRTRVLRSRVTSIDLQRKQVYLNDEGHKPDYILITWFLLLVQSLTIQATLQLLKTHWSSKRLGTQCASETTSSTSLSALIPSPTRGAGEHCLHSWLLARGFQGRNSPAA